MPRYLATGQTIEGKSVTEELDAGSADEAVRLMEERGYSEVELHMDDAGAHYYKGTREGTSLQPRDFLTLRNLPRPLGRLVVVTRLSYQKSWILNLLCVTFLGYRRWMGAPWIMLDTLGVVVLSLPLIMALMTVVFSRSNPYQKLMDAVSWGRWEEVLDRVNRGGIPVSPDELAFRKASALAGLGRLEEAVQSVSQFGEGDLMPQWMYCSRLGVVYMVAKRRDEVIQLSRRAVELAPENATVLVDHGINTIVYRHDPVTARNLLANARSHALSDTVQPFALWLEGLIALEEKRPGEARELLESALEDLSRFRFASPLIGLMLDRFRAFLAIACAQSGEFEAAMRHYRQALPRLRALDDDDLIDRCTRAIGMPIDS
jgi:hypothetical protein